ncbi:MAG: NirD/YgiW/YdeI family stress tolerance protein [Mailhella sp.]|nr:NirD/YgiW/YdeI family stress tolerance protein [Mailhella sp.]
MFFRSFGEKITDPALLKQAVASLSARAAERMLLATLASPSGAGVTDGNGNGFHGPKAKADITTVAQALAARDDTPVILTGSIMRRSPGDHEHYVFRDATGEIIVDIDDKLFAGRTVTPKMTIRIFGKIDKDASEPTEIDVKSFDVQ